MKEIEAWLARDEDNALWLIIGGKPVKLPTPLIYPPNGMWGYPSNANSMELNSCLFPEVKWSDDEPTKVKLVIEK